MRVRVKVRLRDAIPALYIQRDSGAVDLKGLVPENCPGTSRVRCALGVSREGEECEGQRRGAVHGGAGCSTDDAGGLKGAMKGPVVGVVFMEDAVVLARPACW